jgi:hypothetical protein
VNALRSFAQAQARYDAMLPPEPGPEPSEDHFDTAFDMLVEDRDLMAQFMDEAGPDTVTVFQLYHRAGLPRHDMSERDDDLIESYEVTFRAFFDHYRDWLGLRLADTAQDVMQREIDEAREEAEEYAAADRLEAMGDWV